MKFLTLPKRLLPSVLVQVLPVTIIALLAIGYFAQWSQQNAALAEQNTRLDHFAVQSSVAISARLQNVVETAVALAENDLIKNSLIDISERDRYIQTLFQSLRVPGVRQGRVTLVDYRGRQIASNTTGANYTDAAWISTVLGGTSLTQVAPSGMIVGVPVTLSNLVEGAIVIEIGAPGIQQLLRLPIQADAYAIKTVGGDNILLSDPDFDLSGNIETDQQLAQNWLWAETTIDGFSSLRLSVSNRMDTVLASVKQQYTFLLVAIILSAAAVAAAIVVTGMKIAAPIGTFMVGVERVSQSADLGFRMEPTGSDEFRKLTQSFNGMLNKIEQTTSSRDYVDSILNSMNELLLVVSADGKIQSGNRALSQMIGCKAEELPGTDVSRVVSDEWKDISHLDGEDTLPIECRLLGGQEIEIPVQVSVSELRQTGNNSGDKILVLSDIREQKKSRLELDQHIGELERSNADLELFAYVASHDLKAPLRAIRNLTDWIIDDAGDSLPETSREYMTLLRGRVSRLDALLEGLLQYARVGRNEVDLEDVDTHELVSEVVELIAPPETIKVHISEDLPTLRAAPVPLQQVFHNLIGNALKHHDQAEGFIRITGRDLGEQFEFSVEDDGPGIPEKYHERIFKIFQTLKSRDETEGSGMGLALVQKMVRSYGGTVELKSGNGNRGAVFSFTWDKNVQSEGIKNYG